jgi:hypothetical protein
VLKQFLRGLDPQGLNAVDVAAALVAAALLELGPVVRRLVPHLLALQEIDGAWPGARWFVDPADKVWSSAAISTALALEALGLADGDVGIAEAHVGARQGGRHAS